MSRHRRPPEGLPSKKPDGKEPDRVLVGLLLMVILKVADWLRDLAT